jgi:hypothetical protein
VFHYLRLHSTEKNKTIVIDESIIYLKLLEYDELVFENPSEKLLKIFTKYEVKSKPVSCYDLILQNTKELNFENQLESLNKILNKLKKEVNNIEENNKALENEIENYNKL